MPRTRLGGEKKSDEKIIVSTLSRNFQIMFSSVQLLSHV